MTVSHALWQHNVGAKYYIINYAWLFTTLKGSQAPSPNAVDIKIEEGAVMFEGNVVEAEEYFESLRTFIQGEEALAENREACRAILKLEDDCSELMRLFRRDVEELILLVENETPLEGRCNICRNYENVRILGDRASQSKGA